MHAPLHLGQLLQPDLPITKLTTRYHSKGAAYFMAIEYLLCQPKHYGIAGVCFHPGQCAVSLFKMGLHCMPHAVQVKHLHKAALTQYLLTGV